MGFLNKKFIYNNIINVIIFSLVLTILLLYEYGVIPAHKSGFFCNDPAISLPYREDDTIPAYLLIIVAVIVPPILISASEFFYNKKPQDNNYKTTLHLAFLWTREYMVGLGHNAIIVEIMKMTIGKPRPSFYAICRPLTNCTLPTEYVENFECTNKDLDWHTILDANRSFPSGHASISVHTALFIFLYLKQRCKGPWMWVMFLQTICLTWGAITPLSRIIDFRHHWWDVLAGTFIGIASAIYSVYVLCKYFSTEEKSSSKTFTLVVDKLTGRPLNHIIDQNNRQRNTEIHPV